MSRSPGRAAILVVLITAGLCAGNASAKYMRPPAHLSQRPAAVQVTFWTRARNHYSYVCHASSWPAQRRSHCRAWRWARRELAAARALLVPVIPHASAWECIHRYEGSWTDPAPPYYGGLQMDLGFQRSYGADLLRTKGTADHWTPAEQMMVAERAYRSGRGFYPWPNTARECGLI